MEDIKITGVEDIARLMAKGDKWQPPGELDEILASVKKVVSASRYTDMYRETSAELLQAIIRIKAQRCLRNGEVDIEELVDIQAYTLLLTLKMVEEGELDWPVGGKDEEA